MRTMFAVGHQNRTHTTIVIKGRLQQERRTDAAKGEGPVATTAPRPEVPVALPPRTRVH